VCRESRVLGGWYLNALPLLALTSAWHVCHPSYTTTRRLRRLLWRRHLTRSSLPHSEFATARPTLAVRCMARYRDDSVEIYLLLLSPCALCNHIAPVNVIAGSLAGLRCPRRMITSMQGEINRMRSCPTTYLSTSRIRHHAASPSRTCLLERP
jgi:hypothetical protein